MSGWAQPSTRAFTNNHAAPVDLRFQKFASPNPFTRTKAGQGRARSGVNILYL
jgi:hypothetical protein